MKLCARQKVTSTCGFHFSACSEEFPVNMKAVRKSEHLGYVTCMQQCVQLNTPNDVICFQKYATMCWDAIKEVFVNVKKKSEVYLSQTEGSCQKKHDDDDRGCNTIIIIIYCLQRDTYTTVDTTVYNNSKQQTATQQTVTATQQDIIVHTQIERANESRITYIASSQSGDDETWPGQPKSTRPP